MFRSQTNQFDDVIARATDENLTSENWALILDVCDQVSAAPTGPQSAVAALIKRLAHRNANVQLYTLELANSLSQNCGLPVHRELASRSFTDALIRLASDRTTHQQVKTKVLERMQGWSESFRGQADLGIMEQACDKLRRTNPTLQPPNKPVKREIEDVDRRKEDDELQMALELSLRDKGPQSVQNENNNGGRVGDVMSNISPREGEQQQQGTTAATVSRVKALYDFTPSEPGELAFRKGDIIAVLESVYKDWWRGSLRGQTGIFPLNYVEKMQDPTKEELEKDANTEGEVFAQIRNVEKLLALLSVRGENSGRDMGNEDEITEMYNQTLAIRPKLIELIGKYSQKKDDFTQLNEKFIKARRDYESLLEASMAQPPTVYDYPHSTPQQNHTNAYPPNQHNYQSQQQIPQQSYQQQRPTSALQGQYNQLPGPQSQYYPSQTSHVSPGDQYPQFNGPSSTSSATIPQPAFHFLPANAAQRPPDSTQQPLPTVMPFTSHYYQDPLSIPTPTPNPPQELGTGNYEAHIDQHYTSPRPDTLNQLQPQPQSQQQLPLHSLPQASQVVPQQPSYPAPLQPNIQHSAPPSALTPGQQQQQQQNQQNPPTYQPAQYKAYSPGLGQSQPQTFQQNNMPYSSDHVGLPNLSRSEVSDVQDDASDFYRT